MSDAEEEEEVEETQQQQEEVADEEEETEKDISNNEVCTKYQEAGKIANLALQGLVMQATVGAKILDLCKFGDDVVAQKCASVFAKGKNKIKEKGIAFPTCVSVNECVCHFSPLETDVEQPALAVGDMVKVDVGCHIDGYIATAAHTFVVGSTATVEKPLTGRQADVLTAAHIASEVVTKLMRPGNTNSQITAAIAQVAASFGVSAVSGVLSHRMKRFVIDGNKVILLRQEVEQKVETQSFELNEVYSVDVAMSTGDGKPRESMSRTTVFKRAVDKNYRLKMRASRYLFNEVNQKYPALPFALRALTDERTARMGVVECLKHELLHPYPVLYEKKGDHIAHFKFTVLILPSGATRITGLPSFAAGTVVSDKPLSAEIAAIMSTATKKNKKKKPKKKAGKGEAEEA